MLSGMAKTRAKATILFLLGSLFILGLIAVLVAIRRRWAFNDYISTPFPARCAMSGGIQFWMLS
jgi:hypothetical protein